MSNMTADRINYAAKEPSDCIKDFSVREKGYKREATNTFLNRYQHPGIHRPPVYVLSCEGTPRL